MKIVKLILLFACLSSTYILGQSNDKTNYVLNKFHNTFNSIVKMEYNIQRIDTFSSGHVWDKNGYAIIEKVKNDLEYGFYFFGENISVKHISIYDGEKYIIDKNENKYDIPKSLKGSPGEQMVSAIGEIIFFQISDYKDVLVKETDKTYKIEYIFENDTTYNVENIKKIIELDKKTFLPLKLSATSYSLGNLSAHHFLLNNLKINSDVKNTVGSAKNILEQYSPKEIKNEKIKSILNTSAPKFDLPKIFDTKSVGRLPNNKVTLIDFWEIWCGPCIASLPKVEKIFNKYSDKIDVIGIVSNDLENARKMLNTKNITFPSLVGNKSILNEYYVNSFPRYFLIDRTGKVVNEYHGFSDDIENDIIKLLK